MTEPIWQADIEDTKRWRDVFIQCRALMGTLVDMGIPMGIITKRACFAAGVALGFTNKACELLEQDVQNVEGILAHIEANIASMRAMKKTDP